MERIKRIFLILLLLTPIIFCGCAKNEEYPKDWKECWCVAVIYDNNTIGVFNITKDWNNSLGNANLYTKKIFIKYTEDKAFIKIIYWSESESIYEIDLQNNLVIKNYKE